MTQQELNMLLEEDPYHVTRIDPSNADIRLFLHEVDYHCPICGKPLQSRAQAKPEHKPFQIAHIYPNRPTLQQFEVLHNLERLGKTTEDFENKIALCIECHSRQDYRTTKDDYNALLSIKKRCLERSALHDVVSELNLEKELKQVIDHICKLPISELSKLNMNPVRIADKFEDGDAPVLSRITGYVTQYYTFIRDLFRELDGKNGFVFNALCLNIRASYLKMSAESNNKEEIFNQLSALIKRKTSSVSPSACEAVAAFFVQNCEVFNEIPR